jgi:hypothetical protein
MASARRFWNLLIEKQRFAEDQVRHGKRGTLYKEYEVCLLSKTLTGRITEINDYAKTHGIPKDQAAILVRKQKSVDDILEPIRNKQGRIIRWLDRRDRAVHYAMEIVDRMWKDDTHPNKLHQGVKNALLRKFGDSNKLYIKGKRRALRFKRRGDNIAIQTQITSDGESTNFVQNGTFDLRKIGRADVFARVPIHYHRAIPENGTIKQVAITTRGQRYYVVFMVEEPDTNKRRFTPEPGTAIGIDPGSKIALAISSLDGSYQREVSPPIAKDKQFLKTLRRKQRKADRMLRAANPDCFNPDETWKRRLPHTLIISDNLKKLPQSIRSDQEHVARARKDFYHNVANEVLQKG